jgi:hypothetical protein
MPVIHEVLELITNELNWGCPADLLTNQSIKDQGPWPHLEGTAGKIKPTT